MSTDDPPPEKKDPPRLKRRARTETHLMTYHSSPETQPPSPFPNVSNRDAMLKALLDLKPSDGEDFALFAVVMDDPHHPTWEERRATYGRYEQAARACVALTHMIVARGFPKSGIRIEFYQGNAARRYIVEAARQEEAFQQERKGQRNN